MNFVIGTTFHKELWITKIYLKNLDYEKGRHEVNFLIIRSFEYEIGIAIC